MKFIKGVFLCILSIVFFIFWGIVFIPIMMFFLLQGAIFRDFEGGMGNVGNYWVDLLDRYTQWLIKVSN